MADAADEPLETLPLDAWHRARGARMVGFAGYQMPIQYDGIVAEHLWTRAHVGLFDVSHMGQLRLSGADAARELERLLPSDIQGLGVGKVRYSLLLAEDGGILDDLMVTNTGDALFVIVNGATKWDDIAYLREHLPDSVEINHLADQALLAVQGPKAVAVVAAIVPGVEALFFMESAVFDWQGVPLAISRSGYTGEDGVEISVPAEHAEALADVLCSDARVKPIGLGARDSLRLEAGLPLYGHDLTPDIDPVAADLTFAIQKRRREAGGFFGSDRILGALRDGPTTKRVGLRVEGRLPAREGASILEGDAVVGAVTSGGFSPTLQAPIAMAYVDATHAALGTELTIDVRGKRLGASVVPMPFVPHTYHRKGRA